MANGKKKFVWIALALCIYLFCSLTYLGLPGLHYDEVNFIMATLGKGNEQFIAWAPEVLGKKLPLMVMDYIGALKSFIYVPVFAIFGTSASAVRLPVVCIGLITLLLSYALLHRMFDRRIALAGLLLFASDPTFIFANKLDWGPVSLMLALEVSSLYFMWRWMSEGKRYFLGIAGFLFGLGLYNKIIFAWYIAAFFTALLLCFRGNLRNLLRWRQLACFVPAFVLGCLPLIAFNISVPFRTFRHERTLAIPGIETCLHRYSLFRGSLQGGDVYYVVNKEEVTEPSAILKNRTPTNTDRIIETIAGLRRFQKSLVPMALLLSIAAVAILCGFNRVRKRREILFIGTQLAVIALLILLSAEVGGVHHVIAVYPFVFYLIAFAVSEVARWLFKSTAISTIVVGLCMVPVMLSQLAVDARYLRSFQVMGGVEYWSDAIYDLAAFAREHPNKDFILMGWGTRIPLVLLTNGSIRHDEFGCGDKDPKNCIEPLLACTNCFLVFYAPPFGNEQLLNGYKQLLERHRLQSKLEKVFYQRDRRPVYLVYEGTGLISDLAKSKGGFSYLREGEDFDAKSGGGLDIKDGAWNRKALGAFWGHEREDFASYKFTLPHDLSDARLYLRYAFENPEPQPYYLYLDGLYLDAIKIPSSRGFGYTAEQWRIFETRLGNLAAGNHELKIKPAKYNQVMNLDFWCLSEGPSSIRDKFEIQSLPTQTKPKS